MKRIVIVLFLSICSISCGLSASQQSTTVYIVRHAEKDMSDTKNQDPDLNELGKKRVLALNEKLKNEKIDAVFSSKYKRTYQTGVGVAEKNGLKVQEYEAHDFQAISDLIKSKYKNKKVLILGHSNTVLELIEAFGAERPFKAMTDGEYDFFFEVKLGNKGKGQLRLSQFGEAHRSTNVN